jgi:hypothetical protein
MVACLLADEVLPKLSDVAALALVASNPIPNPLRKVGHRLRGLVTLRRIASGSCRSL